MTRQLAALREGALKVASGELGTRVEVRGADEVADLARSFNRMSEELGQYFERKQQLEQARRDLLAAVSHDLRTPLASIRAMVEAINDRVVTDPDTVQRYLALIQQESQHLGQLIDDLFELSRIESGSLELRLQSIPLPELVAETVEGLRVQAEERGVELSAVCQTGVPTLPLDGPRIQRVLINLIQNAVRHTPAGGEVRVEVAREDGHVRLVVADTGEGIALEDQARIFDQFYRGEKSRSRDSGGTGLGLAIARGIVEAHHGTIRVDSKPGMGARFVVTL
jgi:signal transduction histidine kinase